LVPSGLAGTKNLVVAGGGNFGTTDHVVSAVTSDGRSLLAYVPPTRKAGTRFTVDMSSLIGPSRARWFDPGSGAYKEITGGPFPNVGGRTFETPGVNAAGDRDWVLQLQVTP